MVREIYNFSKSTSFVKQIQTAASEHPQNQWLILTFHEENYWKKN